MSKLLVAGCCLALALFAQSLSIGLQEPKAPAPACPADPSACALPSCRCASQTPPAGIQGPNLPQIVFLTFDDAITVTNHPFYEAVFAGRKNPNGADISATFFLTHEYSNYSLVHSLWRKGHEMALHSITHTTTTQYWATMNESVWSAEIIEQAGQIAHFANIPRNEIRGMRAPFLQIGGNPMYRAISDGGLTWDCSRPTRIYRSPGLWPYTNDYRSIMECAVAPCPDEAFPGFWTVPMLDFMGDDDFPCAMVDECTPVPMTEGATYNLLMRNFNDTRSNKAPFGVFTHAAWLVGPVDRPEFAERMAGYVRFLDYLGTLNDVFIVSISQAIEWMKTPTPMADINDFAPWAPKVEAPDNCRFPRNCRYDNGTWERFMSSCVPCPVRYPWVYSPLGTN